MWYNRPEELQVGLVGWRSFGNGLAALRHGQQRQHVFCARAVFSSAVVHVLISAVKPLQNNRQGCHCQVVTQASQNKLFIAGR